MMTGNNISLTQSDTAMKFLTNIQYLNLANNKIQSLCLADIDLFSNMKYLLKLDLSYNYIADLKQNCFGSLQSLELLFLEGNLMTILTIFGHLIRLSILNISNNKLNVIGMSVLMA